MTRMVPSVLIVDDEKHTREGLQQALAENYDVTIAASADEAFNLLDAQPFDVPDKGKPVQRRRIRFAPRINEPGLRSRSRQKRLRASRPEREEQLSWCCTQGGFLVATG